MRYVVNLSLLIMGKIAAVELPYAKVVLKADSYTAAIVPNIGVNPDLTVKSISEKENYDIVVNGGYFGSDNKPLGYSKFNGVEYNGLINKSLSGILAFNGIGNINLLWVKSADVSKWDGVIQNGPFIIDPGGKMGIQSNDGRVAKRLCVGRYDNGNVALIFTKNITLFSLAKTLMDNEPGIDSVLNMDGGPMAGLWCKDNVNMQNNNTMAAVNYIGIKFKAGLTSR